MADGGYCSSETLSCDFTVRKLGHTAVRRIDGIVTVDGAAGDAVIEE